jgi:DNA-binding SARP family transcriptional activator
MTQQQNKVAILGRLGVYPMVRLSLSGRRMLAYLAIRGETVARASVSEALWPDAPDECSRANLRRALWQMPRGWITAAADELMLDAETDFGGAQRVAARGLAGERLTFAEICLLSNDILPGWHEEWVLSAHETFHLLRVQALEAACRTLAAAGEFALATQAGAAALAAEPLRESAAEALIEAHLAQRNRYEAIQCFRSLARRLEAELGVAPDPALARRLEGLELKRQRHSAA